MGLGILGRRTATGAVLAVAVAVALPIAAGSGAETGTRAAGLEPCLPIKILSSSQARILDRKRIRIKVRSCPGPALGTFRAKSKRPGVRPRRIARKREEFLNRRPEVIGLRLNRRGKRLLRRCKPRNLVVRGEALFQGDIILAGKAREALVRDSRRCLGLGPGSGGGSRRDYAITPPGDATHTNSTPRELVATGTGGDAVHLALFSCENVSAAGSELAFTAAGGLALRGSPAGGFSAVDGSPTAGSPQEVGPAGAGAGNLDFEINGADGCATPIVYRDSNANDALDVDPAGIPTEPYGGSGRTRFEAQGVTFQNPGRCDPLDPAVCLQPFPSDHFTVADPGTDTGRRIALQSASMPQSNLGAAINPSEQNRNDGFSPGSMLITKVPGLETPEAFSETDPVPITDIERGVEEDAPIVVIDAGTGERHLIWSELDANPTDPADVNLIIRPAVNFEEGHRYVVALRDLRAADGSVIEAQRPFQLYRDAVITSDPAVEQRRPEFEDLFTTLDEAGIAREDLYLAWDFTIASERNLTERMLTIRDDAFSQLGDTNLADLEVQGQAPTFQVTGVTDYATCASDGTPACSGGLELPLFSALPLGPGDLPLVGGIFGPTLEQLSTILGMPPEDDRIARKVEGQVLVPCYTNQPLCQTGSQFAYSSATDNIPNRLPGNVTLANFTCNIPRAALTQGAARPSLYGHGLLGAAGEVSGGNVKAMANEHNMMMCATDWAGFATQDLPTIATILQDVSTFPKLVDRTQQGMLNFLYLGRAMIHPQGFSASPAFRMGGQSVIDTERLFYDGNSQGGILGGALAAVAPDYDRAVLGVPGMNYSTLLRRSVDFEPYAEGEFVNGVDLPVGLYDRYPNELERPLLLALIQMLWDRGEANGYAHHMTSDPLANTPPHEVLLHPAFGDHQVSIWTAEVEARTIGAATNPFPLEPGRHPDVDPLFGIPRIGAFPYDGSALIYFDSGPPSAPLALDGVVAPPISNIPPRPPEYGSDPHSHPRNDPNGRIQKSEFLRIDGKVVDVCGGGPCYSNGYTGAP